MWGLACPAGLSRHSSQPGWEAQARACWARCTFFGARPNPAGEELRAAVEEWQVKRGTAAAGAQRLTTAFLDGIYPIVDVYELKVPPADPARNHACMHVWISSCQAPMLDGATCAHATCIPF